jgi:hypothetical protein
MMASEDIRACNRLERNARRLEKVISILESVHRENDLADLDILFVARKIEIARDAIVSMRKRLVS